MTNKFGAGLALGIVGTILLAVAVWLTVAYSGAYNVAASDQHADPVRWTLTTTMHRSVANRAGGAGLPENFSEDLIAQGAHHYASSCAHCLHWIIANGIKMTGMPAFGPHHAPGEIVALTAFVTSLPGLSADNYAALTGGANGAAAK